MSAPGKQDRQGRFNLSGQSTYVVLIFLASALLIPLSGLFSPSLGSWSTASAILVVSSMLVVVGFGQGLVILVGELDLSLPAVISLSGVLTTAWLGTSPSVLTFAEVLAIAAGIGIVNGVGVTFFRIPSFIMTLGTQLIIAGVALGYTKGTVPGRTPSFLSDIMLGRWVGVPTPIFLLVAIALIGTVIQRYTTFGRRMYAVGSNHNTARISGVRVNAVVIGAFTTSAVAAALAGMLLVGYGGGATLDMGNAYFLSSIAVVIVGGSSILGGRGHFLGTVGAAIFLTTISTVIQSLGISQGWQTFIYGLLIIAVIGLLNREFYALVRRFIRRPSP